MKNAVFFLLGFVFTILLSADSSLALGGKRIRHTNCKLHVDRRIFANDHWVKFRDEVLSLGYELIETIDAPAGDYQLKINAREWNLNEKSWGEDVYRCNVYVRLVRNNKSEFESAKAVESGLFTRPRELCIKGILAALSDAPSCEISKQD